MVIYRGSDGKPGYHQTDDIHDAVGFVEQMRNDQGVEHARIFRLEEVVFQYKPYYRVELAESGDAAGELEETDQADVSSDEGSTTDDVASVPSSNGSDAADAAEFVEDDDANSGAKKGLFGR
jgi:hypothetical protein